MTLIKQIPDKIWGDVWRTHRTTGRLVRGQEWSQLFYMVFPDYVPVDSVVAGLRARPEIKFAGAPIIAVRDAEPNDPEYANGGQWALTRVIANKAWDVTTGSSDIVVAIVEAAGNGESGIPKTDHPDFQTALGESKFAPGGQTGPVDAHATEVAGMVGAATDNNIGMASLGWNIRMKPFAFQFSNDPLVSSPNLAATLDNVLGDTDVKVINMSFGLLTTESFNCGSCLGIVRLAGVDDIGAVVGLLDEALDSGIIVVGSAGNNLEELVTLSPACMACLDEIAQERYPAAYKSTNPDGRQVIAVAAIQNAPDPRVPNNNFGDFIDVAAPGILVKTTITTGQIGEVNGTSFSAPMVSALAGLVKSIDPAIGPVKFENILAATSTE